nr:uncharacterized protein LOC128694619 [Cherax quadricarinatus]XP_053640740.1 uncharacterized protein LOC128694619 [Cherax quadricarinatus]XP_053640741.1 uncharacterized protein LOC128694619 [Cherax quadricarinatus]XP_053640742.1 uncharacterized protein LOC128694619 [Cherax quadricarinatus]
MSANILKCFHCPDCSKEFSKEKTLIKHFKVHSSGKSYRCKICYNVYPSKRQYNDHKKTHLEKEYSSCVECEKKVLKTLLHRKCCEECFFKPKKYLCEKCGKSYDSLVGVRIHIKKGKHSTLFLQCFICALTFHSNMALFLHVSQHSEYNVKIVGASEQSCFGNDCSKPGNLEFSNTSLHFKVTNLSMMVFKNHKEVNEDANRESSQASTSEEKKVLQGMNRAISEHYKSKQVMPEMNSMLQAERMQELGGLTLQGNTVQQAITPNNTILDSYVVLPQQQGMAQERIRNKVSLPKDSSASNNSTQLQSIMGFDYANPQERKVPQDEISTLGSEKYGNDQKSVMAPQKINSVQYELPNCKRVLQEGGTISLGASVALQVHDKPQPNKDTPRIPNQECLLYEKMFGSELNMGRYTQLHNKINNQAGSQDLMTLHHAWPNGYCDVLLNGLLAENVQLHEKIKSSNPVAEQDKNTEEHLLLDCEVTKSNELGIHMKDIGEKEEVLIFNVRDKLEKSMQDRHFKQGNKQQLLYKEDLQCKFEPHHGQTIQAKTAFPVEDDRLVHHNKLTTNGTKDTNKVFGLNKRDNLQLINDMKNETLLMYKLWLERKKKQSVTDDIESKKKDSDNCLEMLSSEHSENKLKLSFSPKQNMLTNSHHFDIRSTFHVGNQHTENENVIFSETERHIIDQFDEKWATVPLQNSIVTGGVNVEDYINHLMWH